MRFCGERHNASDALAALVLPKRRCEACNERPLLLPIVQAKYFVRDLGQENQNSAHSTNHFPVL